jgi:hypothetical protein
MLLQKKRNGIELTEGYCARRQTWAREARIPINELHQSNGGNYGK